jgi:NADPH-dependent glutamate synthase beta subunit-like oxidoreductase
LTQVNAVVGPAWFISSGPGSLPRPQSTKDRAMLKPHDMTPVVDLTREKGTGPVRGRRPVYVDLMPPCNAACPAGENIQAWLALAQAGRYRQAWEEILRNNPLPGTHGRACYHPCESRCNRQELDASVSIHAVERFLGDMAVANGWVPPVEAPPSGKRVLVVGAGPSGLSAAYHLTRLGHQLEIHEAGPVPGGLLHFGIPAYRLPRAELMAEIARIEKMGVKIVLNHKVEDVLAERDQGRFDAVFIAIGAHISKNVGIPARDAARVLGALPYLRDVSHGEAPQLGRRVVVFGGGNTAMDVARTAKRMGATETLIIYHRDRAHMPAHAFEADEALAEGVKIRWLTAIREVTGQQLRVERIELDEAGKPKPTGEFETLEADAVVLALGQQAESAFMRKIPGVEFKPDGTVLVGKDMMTGHPGVFAGGDMVPSERTMTVAVGHGKLAARNIDGWLRGQPYAKAEKNPTVTFAMLNLPVFSDADPTPQAQLAMAERVAGFSEIIAGLSERDARREAQRCLSCGNCFECDNCYAACPEDAIDKLGPGRRYRYDYAKCTGCSVCFEQCPCHAIEMIPEPA